MKTHFCPLLMVLASPVAAEKISLNEISSYFNAMTTAEAQFSQITDTGETSTGRLFIRRPGRIRFEYDPPEATLVVVGGGQVAVFDPKSRDEPLRFPLAPLPAESGFGAGGGFGATRYGGRAF